MINYIIKMLELATNCTLVVFPAAGSEHTY